MSNSEEWLTPDQVADMLGMAVGTLRVWRYQRRGPAFFKAGAKVLYSRATVERWLQSRRVDCA